VVVLVSVDGLRTEHLSIVRTILWGLIVGAIVAVAADLVGTNAAHPGLGAAILLVLWYGGRGVAGAVGGRSRNRELIAEYSVFVIAAVAGMIWMGVARL
jgi:hypothetical protein